MNVPTDYLMDLYRPTVTEQVNQPTDIADVLHGRLYGLSRDPSPEDAALVAVYLDGALKAVRRLQETLTQEQEVPDGITI